MGDRQDAIEWIEDNVGVPLSMILKREPTQQSGGGGAGIVIVGALVLLLFLNA